MLQLTLGVVCDGPLRQAFVTAGSSVVNAAPATFPSADEPTIRSAATAASVVMPANRRLTFLLIAFPPPSVGVRLRQAAVRPQNSVAPRQLSGRSAVRLVCQALPPYAAARPARTVRAPTSGGRRRTPWALQSFDLRRSRGNGPRVRVRVELSQRSPDESPTGVGLSRRPHRPTAA